MAKWKFAAVAVLAFAVAVSNEGTVDTGIHGCAWRCSSVVRDGCGWGEVRRSPGL